MARLGCSRRRGQGGRGGERLWLLLKAKGSVCSVADCVNSGSPRQQLFQLVQDTGQTPSPPASSRRPAGSRPARSPGSWPVLKEEVPPIDSFFRKAEVCASTTADGLAGTVQKIFNTEDHHNLDSTAAEADGKDDELGSRESPECTQGHEKPSTSLLKAVRKGETLNVRCVLLRSPLWLRLAVALDTGARGARPPAPRGVHSVLLEAAWAAAKRFKGVQHSQIPLL